MNSFNFDKYKYDFLNSTEFFDQIESIKELALDDEDITIIMSETNKQNTFAVTVFIQTNPKSSFVELFEVEQLDVDTKTECFYYKKDLAIVTAYCKLRNMSIPVKYTRILDSIGDYRLGDYLVIFLKNSERPYTQGVTEDAVYFIYPSLKEELEKDNIDRILVIDDD